MCAGPVDARYVPFDKLRAHGVHTYRVIGRKAPGFLRWRSWGGAERRALLLHGSTSSSATWWRIGPALAEAGWRVKAPDLPSHGASPRADKSLTPEVAAEWVAAELADRPIDLVVGHSFGAAVALALLDRGPAIGHLVLEEPPGPQSVDWEAEAEAVPPRWRRPAATRSPRTRASGATIHAGPMRTAGTPWRTRPARARKRSPRACAKRRSGRSSSRSRSTGQS